MQAKTNEQQLSLLVKALLSLENEEETTNLLADLCTIREVQDLGQRIEVARLLRAQMTYNDIAEATGASTATISRVNRSLNFGHDGYDLTFRRLKERASADPAFLSALLETETDRNPLSAFCRLSTGAGLPLYEMDVIEAGEEAYAAMKRSTNGGGENSPLLEYQDDYYAMFLAELKAMKR